MVAAACPRRRRYYLQPAEILTHMIRQCEQRDFETIYEIINDGAQAYKGVIPEDCWSEPYMSRDELQHEIDAGVVFSGYEESGTLLGVMGVQPVKDVTLIRHAYVRLAGQRQGIGQKLLLHLRASASSPVLIGTWADASWAIRFYEKNGFRLVGQEEKDRLLPKYWQISRRQQETSVVLADASWWKTSRPEASSVGSSDLS